MGSLRDEMSTHCQDAVRQLLYRWMQKMTRLPYLPDIENVCLFPYIAKLTIALSLLLVDSINWKLIPRANFILWSVAVIQKTNIKRKGPGSGPPKVQHPLIVIACGIRLHSCEVPYSLWVFIGPWSSQTCFPGLKYGLVCQMAWSRMEILLHVTRMSFIPTIKKLILLW